MRGEGVAPLLRVNNITKRYAGVVALEAVSVTVFENEVVGLLGANGAGKTTLLDVIGGEQSSDSGSVALAERALTGPPHARARQGLARTFQHPKVAPELTILENVAVGLAVRQLASLRGALAIARTVVTGRGEYQLAVEACAAVGLDRIHRRAESLSFG